MNTCPYGYVHLHGQPCLYCEKQVLRDENARLRALLEAPALEVPNDYEVESSWCCQDSRTVLLELCRRERERQELMR